MKSRGLNPPPELLHLLASLSLAFESKSRANIVQSLHESSKAVSSLPSPSDLNLWWNVLDHIDDSFGSIIKTSASVRILAVIENAPVPSSSSSIFFYGINNNKSASSSSSSSSSSGGCGGDASTASMMVEASKPDVNDLDFVKELLRFTALLLRLSIHQDSYGSTEVRAFDLR